MLVKIIITVGLLLLTIIGLAFKYYNKKRSPFSKKRHINLFKESGLIENEKNKKD